MRKIILSAALAILGAHCAASYSSEVAKAPYGADEVAYDAERIWLSGCTDFKSGMNEGDFIKWLRLEGRVKEMPQLRRAAVVKLYMDGWDTARAMKGVITCGDFAQRRANDYVSGIDIRQP